MKKGICCLLIEDDQDDQDLFIDLLHNTATDVGCYAVSNGEEAIHALVEDGLVPDLIVTDLNMPRMGGFEFIKVFRKLEHFRTTPVIVLTSDVSDKQIKTAMALGADAIYSKATLNALGKILRRYFSDMRAATVR